MRIQISCINKSNRYNAHERIISCGGVNYLGQRWKKSQPEIVKEIEERINQYYVRVGVKEVDVIVSVSQWGNKYIKTVDDGTMPNNLLSLPECPLY